MADFFEDSKIKVLLKEEKNITLEEYNKFSQLTKQKGSHREQEVIVTGVSGAEFVIKLRQNTINFLDFSVIVGYLLPNKTTIFRLRRYNGKSHWHKNKIEKTGFYDFHIHTASERYQLLGTDEEYFAEPTDKYSDLATAIDVMIKECNIKQPQGIQPRLI